VLFRSRNATSLAESKPMEIDAGNIYLQNAPLPGKNTQAKFFAFKKGTYYVDIFMHPLDNNFIFPDSFKVHVLPINNGKGSIIHMSVSKLIYGFQKENLQVKWLSPKLLRIIFADTTMYHIRLTRNEGYARKASLENRHP